MMPIKITQNENTNSEEKFELFCKCVFRRYCFELAASRHMPEPSFHAINGAGGDGGVEAYCEFSDGEFIGLQAKYFDERFSNVQVQQIQKSLDSARSNYPKLSEYIIAIPKDLTNFTHGDHSKFRSSGQERFESFCKSNGKMHPGCAIRLWDETFLLDLLSKKEYSRFHDFWFSKRLISKEILERSLERQIKVETHDKYQPDLAVAGKIFNFLEEFLRKKAFYSKIGNELQSLCNRILDSKKVFGDAWKKKKIRDEPNKYTQADAAIDFEIVDEMMELSHRFVETSSKIKDDLSASFKSVSKLQNLINVLTEALGEGEATDEAKRALRILDDLDFTSTLYSLKNLSDEKKVCLIKASAGYGKTFAALNFMDEERQALLQSIYVPASYFEKGCTLAEAICKSVGTPEPAGDESLLEALECYMDWASINYPDDVSPCFAVFVDGLDEVGDDDLWQAKYREAEFLADHYPFLRIVFLSRNTFGFESTEKRRLINLHHQSDVPIETLVEHYFKYYRIDFSLVKRAQLSLLNTPFVLCLFCQRHKDNCGLKDGKSSDNVVGLLQQRVELINSETKKRTGRDRLFFDLMNFLIKDDGKDRFSENEVVKALENVHSYKMEEIISALAVSVEEGLLYKIKNGSDCLGQSLIEYAFTYRNYIDYLVAHKYFKEGSKPLFPYETKSQLLNLYYILQAESESDFSLVDLQASYATSDYLSLLQFIALNGTINDGLRQDIQAEIIGIVKNDIALFWKTFNGLIVPCARLGVPAFGADMLDKILFSFEKPIQRDRVWAYPYPLPEKSFYGVEPFFESNELFEGDALLNDAKWDGLPSLYAWFLCSLDNRSFYKARNRLALWGVEHPSRFLKLFSHYKDVNGPQMIRGLCAIAMNVCNAPKTEKNISCKLIDVYQNIELEYPDLCVRYYFQEMVKAKDYGDYRTFNKHYESLTPCSDAKGASINGYKGYITYDLDRYVLTDPLHSMFSFYVCFLDGSLSDARVAEHQKQHPTIHEQCEGSLQGFFNSKTIDALVDKLGKPQALNSLLELTLGLTDSYFKCFGWDLSFNGEEIKKAESALRPYASTHGLKSRLMTIAEKYTWAIKDIISAYYFDQICEIKGKDAAALPGFDYSILEEFDNPYQDYLFAKYERDAETSDRIEFDFDYSKENSYIGNKNGKVFIPDFDRRAQSVFAYCYKLGLTPLFGHYKQDETLVDHWTEFSSLIIPAENSLAFLEYVRANRSNHDFIEFCRENCRDYTAWKNAHPLDLIWSQGKPTVYDNGRYFPGLRDMGNVIGPVFFTSMRSYYLFQESASLGKLEIDFSQPSRKLAALLNVNDWNGKDFLSGDETKIICLKDECSLIYCIKENDFLSLSQKYRFFWSFVSVDNANVMMKNLRDYDDRHYRIIFQWLCHQSSSTLETISLREEFD